MARTVLTVKPWITYARAGGPSHAVVDAGRIGEQQKPMWTVTACGLYSTWRAMVFAQDDPAAHVTCKSCRKRLDA